MPSAAEFLDVTRAVCSALPDDAGVVGLEVSGEHVTLWTSTPMAVFGPGGTEAERVRASLSADLGRPVKLRIELADGHDDEASSPSGPDTLRRVDRDPPPLPRVPRPAWWTAG